jgi:hypothetical protein
MTRASNLTPFILFALFVLCALLLLMAAPMAEVASNALDNQAQARTVNLGGLSIQMGTHAVDRHGSDAERIEAGCRQNGVFQAFVELADKNTFHLLCQLDNGKLGDWIIIKDKGIFYDKTRFIPRSGKLEDILKWMINKTAKTHLLDNLLQGIR